MMMMMMMMMFLRFVPGCALRDGARACVRATNKTYNADPFDHQSILPSDSCTQQRSQLSTACRLVKERSQVK